MTFKKYARFRQYFLFWNEFVIKHIGMALHPSISWKMKNKEFLETISKNHLRSWSVSWDLKWSVELLVIVISPEENRWAYLELISTLVFQNKLYLWKVTSFHGQILLDSMQWFIHSYIKEQEFCPVQNDHKETSVFISFIKCIGTHNLRANFNQMGVKSVLFP